jgi:hypothetical protein
VVTPFRKTKHADLILTEEDGIQIKMKFLQRSLLVLAAAIVFGAGICFRACQKSDLREKAVYETPARLTVLSAVFQFSCPLPVLVV